ncbi:unnamed protein product [Ectocarpus sp. 12 AP-2014]
MSPQPPVFEHRMTVRLLRLKRLLVLLPMALVLVLVGYAMIPEGTFLTIGSSDVSFFWHSFGHLLVAGGAWILASELVRCSLARRNAGEWHIKLTHERFFWKAPRQPYGREASFDLSLGDIQRCEYRRDGENGQLRSYWIYPQDGTPIRLKDTSGVNIPRVFELLSELGVPYREVET